ncbi:MAG: bifunctional phosphopantothenoylcysteine decarboxylase/phosphopantothenate--cysteine ligase CoaBC [Bacteroidales bacterium]|nr:bifunctional phosphopantothenoylcysteine decarboxylase/phosphopantothenate--cysteine ligase CoaBC [Bacteroidales bacterium]
MLKAKNILIGISGSIAAYKIPILVRLLRKAGANVQIVMTEAAKDFVTPLTLSTVSNRPVSSIAFDKNTGEWDSHVELGRWADLFLMAPLSANTMAKMAAGIADNHLLTTYLSARSKVMFAPAMDLDMYKHPSTSRNIEQLKQWGHIIIEPTEGELASGLCGMGRMEEPEVIFDKINDFFNKKTPLTDKKVLISAGPTYESIDPVRFIGNHSSGKMGYAIAEAIADKGAEVFLVSGPVNITPADSISKVVNITTAEQMYDACNDISAEMDIIIMTAAVADFAPADIAEQKIKKGNSIPKIELKPTKDILLSLGKRKKDNQILIGFALETNNEIENAIIKLENKNLDLIVLNSMQDKGAGFGHSTNQITLIDKDKHPQSFPLKTKVEVAKDIVEKIETLI